MCQGCGRTERWPQPTPRGAHPPRTPISPSHLAQRVTKTEGRAGNVVAGIGEEAASPGPTGSAGSHRPTARCPGIDITRWAHSVTVCISEAR